MSRPIAALLALVAALCDIALCEKVIWSQPGWKIGQTPAQILSGWGTNNWHGESSQRVKIVNDPAGSGTPVLRVEYPKGSYNSDAPGGAQFAGQPVAPQRAAYLSYQLYFDSTFQWVLGGKLPGFFGKTTGCSAGNSADSQHCFSSRLMWRQNGQGILYFYVTKNQQSTFCSGADVQCDFANGRVVLGKTNPNFKFVQGKWHTVKQYVKINDPGSYNGAIQVWIDGKVVVDKQNIAVYSDGKGAIDGVFFSTFFGGSTPDWATKVTTYTYYKDFKITV